ncbi:hypothetical protein BD410DRAFT_899247 [Rickenella mellea]|uniref:Elongation factor Ts, mitochondrial n=1 Tax=Rickenella mellea TaxID=50990 RepID=A0A4Y7Q0P9_9AGAM|nr:hypothetical protein BD410DRAFT_899247 [Rickenella mellea]
MLTLFRYATSSSRRTCHSTLRYYATSETPKPPIKLVAELRKLTETSVVKAREALVASNNDVNGALAWLQKDLATSGVKKAAKVEGRATREGMIGVSVLSRGAGANTGTVRAGMVEVNCETDFVGRNELFGKLVRDIAHTAAFIAERPSNFKDHTSSIWPYQVDALLEAPLLSQSNPTSSHFSTVRTAIRDTISKVGENIELRRAVASVIDPNPHQNLEGYRVASYLHGSLALPNVGRMGILAFLRLRSPHLSKLLASDTFSADLDKLERSLARQIAGFDTQYVSVVEGVDAQQADASISAALYEQPFMMFASEEPVRNVLKMWTEEREMGQTGGDLESNGIHVHEFAKWTVGEPVE